jgi:hypothetical protein
MNSIITNSSFKSPVKGTDPVSKGTFIIEHAYMLWDVDEDGLGDLLTRASGKIKIDGYDNPLFKLAEASPLRLQGLVASVDFGIEKRFIKIETIGGYKNNDDWNITLDPVTFKILDGLEYLENLATYKEDHLC